MKKHGIETPTRIQSLVVPTLSRLLSEDPNKIKDLPPVNNQLEYTEDSDPKKEKVKWRDILFRSETGTGKTLAYLLPLFNHLDLQLKRFATAQASNNNSNNQDNTNSTSVNSSTVPPTTLPSFPYLVITPSRELCNQVKREVERFLPLLNAKGQANVTVHTLLGDEDIKTQTNLFFAKETGSVKKTIKILIGTPHRISNLMIDYPSIRSILQNQLQCLVLDEMDHLLKPLGRYAPLKSKQQRNLHPKPTEEIVKSILHASDIKNKNKMNLKDRRNEIIIVGCSATLNRPSVALFSHTWNRSPIVVKASSLPTEENSPQIPKSISHSYFIWNSSSFLVKNYNSSMPHSPSKQEEETPTTESLNSFDLVDKVKKLCSLFEFPFTFQPPPKLENDSANRNLPNISSNTSTPSNSHGGTSANSNTAPVTIKKMKSALVFIPNSIAISDFIQLVNKINPSLNAVALYKYLGMQSGSDKYAEFEEQFKNGEIRMVVANEDIGRGINFNWLDFVILFEVPKPNAYLHLAGRTGRVGRPGTAITLFSANQFSKFKQLETYFNIQFSSLSLNEAVQ